MFSILNWLDYYWLSSNKLQNVIPAIFKCTYIIGFCNYNEAVISHSIYCTKNIYWKLAWEQLKGILLGWIDVIYLILIIYQLLGWIYVNYTKFVTNFHVCNLRFVRSMTSIYIISLNVCILDNRTKKYYLQLFLSKRKVY